MTGVEFRLSGDLGSAGFTDWICHRARLLDLSGWVSQAGSDEITIVVSGPAALIDAMEMACSLGPADVLVDRIVSRQTEFGDMPNGFHMR